MSEATVTIRELAAALNRKPEQVEAEAAELGMLVKPDWAGRPSLSVADARGLASGEARAAFDHEAAWRQHQVATKAWVEGRSRAMAEAARKVRSTAGTGVQYEKRNPRPSFNGAYSVNLEYVHQEVSA